MHLKDGVTLRGSGYEDTRIELDARAKPVYAIDVSDARIEGFAVAYAGTSSVPTVSLKSSLVAISACRIRNSAVSAVYATDSSTVVVDSLRASAWGGAASMRTPGGGTICEAVIVVSVGACEAAVVGCLMWGS